MKKPGFMAVFLVFFCLSMAVAQDLPPDLKIVPPGAGVPPRLAQLSGIWEGAWEFSPKGPGSKGVFRMDDSGWGVKIAILEINPPKVEAMYASSGSPGNPGKMFRVRDASVSGDDIVLRWGQPGDTKTLTLSSSGPGVAQATLQTEKTAQVLKTTLRKK